MNRKLKVLYITSENTTTSIPLELASYMSKSDKINLYVVTYYGQVVNEPKLGFSQGIIDLNISKSNLSRGIHQLNILIKEIKPDVIHVHHNLSALIAILIARFNKIKLVIKTEHNDHRFLKWYQKIFNIPILFLSDIVVCNSISTKKSFYPWEKLLVSEKAISIYNGINVHKILQFDNNEHRTEMRKKYSLNENERLFFCAARLIKQKNIENLIRAFSAASYENKNIRLLIAGSGDLFEHLMRLKKQLDHFNKIQFVGILPREEIFKLMNTVDFFVMVSWWEGFCNAIVEAMAASCPIICSDISTLHEVVGDETGSFVNPKSINSIKETILEFAAMDQIAVEKLGKKSFKRATELFDIESTANQYLHQYQKVYNREKKNNLYSGV